jgi:general secretion pathway protein G
MGVSDPHHNVDGNPRGGEAMRATKKSPAGFTLIEIMIVVVIIGLLLAMAIPNYNRYRLYAQTQLCIENLSQIENAKQQWALEAGKNEGDIPTETDLVGIDRWLQKMPVCPAAGTYSFNAIGTNATCSVVGHTL